MNTGVGVNLQHLLRVKKETWGRDRGVTLESFTRLPATRCRLRK